MSNPAGGHLPDLGSAALEALLDRTNALLYVVDADERVRTINRALRDRLDYGIAELPDLRALARMLYPDTTRREAVLTAHRAALEAASTRDYEWVLTTRQGDQRQVRWQLVLHGEAGARVLVAIGEDVTDRRKLEQWVRLQAALLERIPEAVVVADPEGRILHWTGAAERLLGYAPRAAIERPLSNLVMDENARALTLGWIDELRQRGQMEWNWPLRRQSGETLDCQIQGARVQNERGQFIAVALVIAPVVAPAKAEEPAEPGLERALGQVSAAALVITDADGVVRVWGRGAERLGGMSAAKAVGRCLFDEVMQAAGQSWEALKTRVAARGRFQARLVVDRPNGTRAPAEVDVQPLRSPDGGFSGVVAAFVDRTELATLADEALTSKTQALDGVFVDGVVRRLTDTFAYFEPDHRLVLARLQDLRTLGRMVAAGTSLREFENFARRSGVGAADRDIDDVMYRLGEGVHHLRGLVDDVTRFGATEIDPPGPVRLSRELEAARDLIGHHFENRIDLELVVDDLPPARASRRPLLRGLVLLLLASAASCESSAEGTPHVLIEGRHQAGWLYLDFKDNGAGYSVDVQSRLTDLPWLAAQPGYAALYLGLAREALRLAGGNLEIGTAAGTGARVRVSFPAAEAAAAVQPVDEPRQEAPRGGQILVVEEDELLRRALERHLGELASVTAFATIAESLPAVQSGGFQAAVLGFPRPESFGLRLLGRFAEIAPDLHRNSLVMIPPGLKQATRDRLLSQGCVVLQRPVDLTTLRSVLQRILPMEEIIVEET